MLIILLSLISSAHAYDHGPREGVIVNDSDHRMHCYGDRNDAWVMHESVVEVGDYCLGDAMGDGEGYPVYKVPNRARFHCNGSVCRPEGLRDAVILYAAQVKNGVEKYGWLEWPEFLRVMGQERER